MYVCVVFFLEEVRNHSVGDSFAVVVPVVAVFGGAFFLVTEDAMPVETIGNQHIKC